MIHYINAFNTIELFLGPNSWPIVADFIEEIMHKTGVIGLGFFRRDGSYYQVKFTQKDVSREVTKAARDD